MTTNFEQLDSVRHQPGHEKGAGRGVLSSLSPFERFVGMFLLLLVLVSGTIVLQTTNDRSLVDIPREGGSYVEGIVGTPRFINPVLADSDADRDISALVYAGLLTRDGTGQFIPELAEHYTISEDKTVYTFTLRENLTFHDGAPLTADDVVFTVAEAADPAVRSPLLANWDGVEVEALDERTVQFTLPAPYAPFIENMRLGILPKHIWESLTPEEFRDSQLNTMPIGAGPYRVSNVTRDRGGILTSYELTNFDNYVLGAPHISTFIFTLFKNRDEVLEAFINGNVSAVHGVTPTRVADLLELENVPHVDVLRAPLLRIFGIFFNHNKQPIFLRDEVRQALDEATPKQAVVGDILSGYGTIIDSPLPVDSGATDQTETTEPDDADRTSTESTVDAPLKNHIVRAQEILEKAGWEHGEDGVYQLKKKDETIRLSVVLSTVNVPEVMLAANRIADEWKEVGVDVEVKVFDPADLTQSVIRPRRYEALLYGEELGYELDLYPFWHSSQRNDPGLNIAQYADIESDALLEKARVEIDSEARLALYREFADRLKEQHAAIFLYAPDFIYLVHDTVHNVSLHPISDRADRFDTVHTWYIETDRVWPFMQHMLD